MKTLAIRLILASLTFATWIAGALGAATPPALLNYQGVLRDASDKPRNGTFDMTFHFFDAPVAGNELLVDTHTGSGGVVVTNGLFNVSLGGGVLSPGSGVVFYRILEDVFHNVDTVYLEVQIGSETLTPRTRVVSAGYALNAGALGGVGATGFVDTSSGAQIKDGPLTGNHGLLGYNDSGAGFGFGVSARGLAGGGDFRATNGSGVADLAVGDYGIRATGNQIGGYFYTPDTFTYAGLGLASGVGVTGSGTSMGGAFSDTNTITDVFVGTPSFGIDSTATSGARAGRFRNTSIAGSGVAYLGYGTYGLYVTSGAAYTPAAFDNGGTSSTFLSSGNWGLTATGQFCGAGCGGGGFFRDTSPATTTQAYVAYADVGIETHASGSGGSFYNTSGVSTAVATSTGFGVVSNGTKSFVQNHPDDPNAVIAYTALEGDEAGTYTRGSARLVGGEARIALGETFRWVTNPDIGLTAHLTPVGDWADLYVAAKNTSEIVVRSRDPRAANAAFDYVVFGLRIGFEDNPVVRDKEHDMPIPASVSGDEQFGRRPDYRRYTALSRFERARRESAGRDEPLDLRAAESLKARIHVFDPTRDGAAFAAPAAPQTAAPAPPTDAGPAASPSGAIAGPSPVARNGGDDGMRGQPADAREDPRFPPNSSAVNVRGTVRAGDLLTVTDAPDGMAVLAGHPGDKGVIGVVAGPRGSEWTGRAPVVVSGVVALCNVDATEGAITVGDLLVASPTPGYAMRSQEAPLPGTVIAKALEPLDVGTGIIRVLVVSR
jgi:hypothetical protein